MPGLYLHIPFCEHKCVYCDFYSIAPDEERSRLGAYTPRFVERMLTELRLRRERTASTDPFDSVFFGGGTPSLLEPSSMEALVEGLRSLYDVEEGAEWTMEANPGTVSLERLRRFRETGLNRVSFGVQSFDERELAFLSRIHSADQARQSVHDARTAGFDNVSIDLMFNIPGQTEETWSATLDDALALGTDHLSCYSLTVESNTPLARLVDGGRVRMPDGRTDEALYALTIQRLKAAGFEQYEVSNFARPGRRSRHNLNYWKHGTYIGFGPSAHSYWNGVRWWNIANLSAYEEALASGSLPVAGEETLTGEQLATEYLFLGLRSEGIDLEHVGRQFGRDVLTDNRGRIDSMLANGLATLRGNVLALTGKGYMICDEICARFEP